MSQAQLEEKVTDYLRKSQALQDQWQRPITGKQLQAEMDRMALHTKQPEVLRELFQALGNDPFVIAECLARPALAERLLTSWYAYDQRIHSDLRERAKAELQGHGTVEQMKQTNGDYSEIEFVRRDNAGDTDNRGASHRVKLNSRGWNEIVQKLAASFTDPGSDTIGMCCCSHVRVRRMSPSSERQPGPSASTQRGDYNHSVHSKDPAADAYEAISIGTLSSLHEDETRYYAVAVIEKNNDQLKLATVSWLKQPCESWLARAENKVATTMTLPNSDYHLPTMPDGTGCRQDLWRATAGPPDGRSSHTAIWTGTEMIVWGGLSRGADINSGGRYTPATDTWIATSNTNAPGARAYHTAVWSGTEMIVWGGDASTPSGGRYNPNTDTWEPTSTANAPDARSGHTAIWIGNEMVVWGGSFADKFGDHYLNTGGRYDPDTDSWTPTNTMDAPDGRSGHTAIWSGIEMIVWGGFFSDDTGFHSLNTGGRYNPRTNSWTATSIANAPSARDIHTAIWTGNEMIVWGGDSYELGRLNTGGRYNPVNNTWTSTSLVNAPESRYAHTAVWTGDEMIVWGGFATNTLGLNTGGTYSPATDSWTTTSIINVPASRYAHTAVWTGDEMIVWGGSGEDYSLNTGGRYNPNANSWIPTATFNVPAGRFFHTAVWTGSEMIIWGGFDRLDTGATYTPITDSWAATAMTDAPAGRFNHTAIWTGSEMIVWGGVSHGQNTQWYNTGGSYNPSANTWTALSISNAPSPRDSHTAIWTGTEMVVWGGEDETSEALDTGGRYNPITDSWLATTTANAPSAREAHTAVWADSDMIVWGGYDQFLVYANTGAKYDPFTNSWTATNISNAPSARADHTATWTGNEMIVWGGSNESMSLMTGGRYDPIADNWAATSTDNAPDGRSFHTAVWTGDEMIVWGGYSSEPLDTGGRYSPGTDSWMPTTTENAPGARNSHTAVWTGDAMIVWGGAGNLNTGGIYCAQAGPTPTPSPTATPSTAPRLTPTPRPRPTPHPRR